MSSSDGTTFTNEEINEQARGNATAMPYLITAFALECGRTPDEAAAFAGRIFSAGWAELQGQGAFAVARAMAMNLASGGAAVTSLHGDDEHAETHVTGVYNDEMATAFGITRDDVDRFNGVFAPIAEHLGFRVDWRRDGDDIVLTLDRA